MSGQLDNNLVVQQYAKAVFEAALDQRALDDVLESLVAVQAVFAEVAELKAFLETPAIPHDEKITWVRTYFEGKVHPLVAQMLVVMTENKRGGLVGPLLPAYQALYDAHEHLGRGELVTATDISATLLKKFEKAMAERFGFKKVILENRVDPGIIGGAIVRMHDQVLDGSFVGKLETLRRQLHATT